VLAASAAVLAVGAAAAFGLYGRQIVSFASHIGGSPTHTEPLEPFAAGAEPLYRIAVAGDVGYANDRAAKTGAAIAKAGPYDALLLLGDNVYPAGDPARLPVTVFEPFKPVLDTGARLLAILGNHDVKDGHTDAQVAALGMPGRWYSEVIGDVTFVALDSNEIHNPEQLAWLEQTLAAATTTWKVVALHHPPYSAGYQGSSLEARAVFSPLFERYGVELVLSGHEHDYERSVPINGVTYIVSGGAADTRRSGREEFTAASVSWHHFVDLNVFADHLLIRGVNQSGRVFDQVTIAAPLSGS
jgi:3',5'-cyclic AMP phosphodiesterase CpdA